jgi:hypothetical protein
VRLSMKKGACSSSKSPSSTGNPGEGRSPNVSPARKGLGINPESDLSAVGAALNLGPLACVIGTGALPPRAVTYDDDWPSIEIIIGMER